MKNAHRRGVVRALARLVIPDQGTFSMFLPIMVTCISLLACVLIELPPRATGGGSGPKSTNSSGGGSTGVGGGMPGHEAGNGAPAGRGGGDNGSG